LPPLFFDHPLGFLVLGFFHTPFSYRWFFHSMIVLPLRVIFLGARVIFVNHILLLPWRPFSMRLSLSPPWSGPCSLNPFRLPLIVAFLFPWVYQSVQRCFDICLGCQCVYVCLMYSVVVLHFCETVFSLFLCEVDPSVNSFPFISERFLFFEELGLPAEGLCYYPVPFGPPLECFRNVPAIGLPLLSTFSKHGAFFLLISNFSLPFYPCFPPTSPFEINGLFFFSSIVLSSELSLHTLVWHADNVLSWMRIVPPRWPLQCLL